MDIRPGQLWDNLRADLVLVTHDVEEAEHVCDRIVVLDRGHVVADGTPAEIVDDLGARATVRFTDPELDPTPLRSLPGVQRAGRHGPEIRVEGSGPVLAHVGAHLVEVGRPALDLRLERPTLTDSFVALTERTPS